MNDFKNISDKYKQQMLDLYKKNPQIVPTANSLNQNPLNITDNPQTVKDTDNMNINSQDIKDVPLTTTTDTDIPNTDDIPLDEKFPPPEPMPFLNQQQDQIQDIPPTKTEIAPNTELQQPNLNSVGYLKIVTTSADQTIPIPEVSVIISKTNNGNEEILYSLMTNQSGETPVIELPTPSAMMSQTPQSSNNGVKPYAMYNISTYLDGYFQVKNLNVPIFAGITSIQRVNMIPLPLHTSERKVITFSETEPNLV